jgi:hypothetical protein
VTSVATFTCDYCNPERSTDEDNEVSGTEGWKGWALVMGPGTPTGWWPVPGKGADGGVGHACAWCMMNNSDVTDDVAARRNAETERLTGVSAR